MIRTILRRASSFGIGNGSLEAIASTWGRGAAIVQDHRRVRGGSGSPSPPSASKPVLLVTAEHATNVLPPGMSFDWQVLAHGELLSESHWAFDPGALASAEAVAQEVLQSISCLPQPSIC